MGVQMWDWPQLLVLGSLGGHRPHVLGQHLPSHLSGLSQLLLVVANISCLLAKRQAGEGGMVLLLSIWLAVMKCPLKATLLLQGR